MSEETTTVFLESGPVAPGCDGLLVRIESVLFLSREPVSSKRLAQLANAPEGTRIRAIIKKLNARYDEYSWAFRIYEIANCFQLRTRSAYVSWLARLHQLPIEIRLSAPTLETLAIIAWQQPVLRATIEKIRGVQCGDTLRQLMEKDLVKIVGKSNDLGRPFLFGTTRNFLHIFGLNCVEELS